MRILSASLNVLFFYVYSIVHILILFLIWGASIVYVLLSILYLYIYFSLHLIILIPLHTFHLAFPYTLKTGRSYGLWDFHTCGTDAINHVCTMALSTFLSKLLTPKHKQSAPTELNNVLYTHYLQTEHSYGANSIS